jgi:hypothetical protein
MNGKDRTMKTLNIAAYGQHVMYADLAKYGEAIRRAGWDSIILAMLHPHPEDDTTHTENIYFGEVKILESGVYRGNPAWPGQLHALVKGTGTTLYHLLAGIGGADVGDFGNIKAIYENHNHSFAGTMLQTNFQVFHDTFPAVTIIDMDVEDTYDVPSFVAFCRMLITIGFGITFCPYIYKEEFWIPSLKQLNQSDPGAVKWWNLQCYDGGQGNDPQVWANAISKAIPGFDTTGFIIPGDWSRHLVKEGSDQSNWYWRGDCPPAVQDLMRNFKGEPSVGGGFIWTIDQILNYAANQKLKPDPHPCGNVGMQDYIKAITAVFG